MKKHDLYFKFLSAEAVKKIEKKYRKKTVKKIKVKNFNQETYNYKLTNKSVYIPYESKAKNLVFRLPTYTDYICNVQYQERKIPVFDFGYTDKYLNDTFTVSDNSENKTDKPCFAWDNIYMYLYPDFYIEYNPLYLHMYLYPDTDYIGKEVKTFEWKYEKETKTFDKLPDFLPITDENISIVGEIACKVALRTMEERSKGHKKAYTKKDGSESNYSYAGESNYAHEIRLQAIRSYKEAQALTYAESIDNGKLQETKVQKKQLVKTAKNKNHDPDVNAEILKDYGYTAKEIKEALAHNYNEMWIPCHESKIEVTEEGKEYNKILSTISTCNDFDDCKQESTLAVIEYIANNPDCSNVWDAFNDGCNAVHTYVKGMKNYQEQVYKKPHNESDERQDESGNEIFEWEKTSEFSPIDESESNSDFIVTIDEILSAVKSDERREVLRKYLIYTDMGYNQKQIAYLMEVNERTVRNYGKAVSKLIDKKTLLSLFGGYSQNEIAYLMGNKTSTR